MIAQIRFWIEKWTLCLSALLKQKYRCLASYASWQKLRGSNEVMCSGRTDAHRKETCSDHDLGRFSATNPLNQGHDSYPCRGTREVVALLAELLVPGRGKALLVATEPVHWPNRRCLILSNPKARFVVGNTEDSDRVSNRNLIGSGFL